MINHPGLLTRAFLCLPIPNIPKLLVNQGHELFPDNRIRWTKPEHLHLTLAFLGDIDTVTARSICSFLQSTDTTPCTLHTTAIAPFPVIGARVLAALIEPAKLLMALQQQTSHWLRDKSISFDDRPFKPHITLARYRKGFSANLFPIDTSLTANPSELWFSERTEQGSVYRKITLDRL